MQIVEAHMTRAARRNGYAIGAGGIPIGKKDHDRDTGFDVPRIQDTNRLMAEQFGGGAVAFPGNISLRYGPALAADVRNHHYAPFQRLSTDGADALHTRTRVGQV